MDATPDPSGRHSTRNLSQEGFVKTTNPINPVQGDREKPGNQGGKPGQGGQVGKPGPFPPRRDTDKDFGQDEPDSGELDR
jgi:hypothetical protein